MKYIAKVVDCKFCNYLEKVEGLEVANRISDTPFRLATKTTKGPLLFRNKPMLKTSRVNRKL